MNILDTIVEKRQKDIAERGVTFGFPIPKERLRRKPIPFIAKTGVILEVKRASPSKGDIAPQLDAPSCALMYEKAGASAISVLTEEHFFKGSVRDLMAVSACVGEGVAVLRKDFLLYPEEIDIAYRAGADAVLLISRILSDDTICNMAKKCAQYQMTALIEVRLEEDLEKLKKIAQAVPTEYIVCGVNARDLQTFAIDLLAPARMLKKIQNILGKDARVIFESGIRTPSAAAFAHSLGFTGLLLGEAAAKNPENATALVHGFTDSRETKNAAFWLRYATSLSLQKSAEKKKKPLVKICGLTSKEDALYATLSGAAFLGFIFSAHSKRNVNAAIIPEIKSILDEQFTKTCQDEHIFAAGEDDEKPLLVGVITEAKSTEAKKAIELCQNGILDVLQLHGEQAIEDFFANPQLQQLPHYCVVNIENEADIDKIEPLLQNGEPRILLDAKSGAQLGGTGKTIDSTLLQKAKKKLPLWLAGGISPQNVASLLESVAPELVDVNSGVETEPGKKSNDALLALFSAIDGVERGCAV